MAIQARGFLAGVSKRLDRRLAWDCQVHLRQDQSQSRPQAASREVSSTNTATAFVGHTDAIENGEIYGWALNTRAPSEAVTVYLSVDESPAAEAVAGYYRPDVAAALQCSGRTGFYVDLDPLCPTGKDVSVNVRFPDGSELSGGPLLYQAPKRQKSKKRKPLLFMHIPKTAGTAFREVVIRNYKQSQVMYIYGDPPGFPSVCLGDVPPQQRRGLQLVFGHYGYGAHGFMPDECDYAALIRCPLNRVWSHYLHLMRDNHPAAVIGDKPKPIEQVLEERQSVHLDNLYVRYFCGLDEPSLPPGKVDHEIYALALQNVEQDNVFLRTQDDLTEAYDSLAEEIGWIRGLRCPYLNESPGPRAVPTAKEASAIRHFNQWDFKLYGHMLRVIEEKRTSRV